MPPHDVTTADRQLAINQLCVAWHVWQLWSSAPAQPSAHQALPPRPACRASALLPLVKNDVSKANSYAVQVRDRLGCQVQVGALLFPGQRTGGRAGGCVQMGAEVPLAGASPATAPLPLFTCAGGVKDI